MTTRRDYDARAGAASPARAVRPSTTTTRRGSDARVGACSDPPATTTVRRGYAARASAASPSRAVRPSTTTTRRGADARAGACSVPPATTTGRRGYDARAGAASPSLLYVLRRRPLDGVPMPAPVPAPTPDRDNPLIAAGMPDIPVGDGARMPVTPGGTDMLTDRLSPFAPSIARQPRPSWAARRQDPAVARAPAGPRSRSVGPATALSRHGRQVRSRGTPSCSARIRDICAAKDACSCSASAAAHEGNPVWAFSMVSEPLS